MSFLPLLAIFLALTASVRAQDYSVVQVDPNAPDESESATGRHFPRPPSFDSVDVETPCADGKYQTGETVTVTFLRVTKFMDWRYAVGCQHNGVPCPGFPTTQPRFNRQGYLYYTYTLPEDGGYYFWLNADKNGAAAVIDPAHPKIKTDIIAAHEECCHIGSCTDPIITGFDNSVFHFDEIGEYVMLESGDGYKVHCTFAGATAANHELEVMERSWTSSLRLFSPNGDMVSCALPAVVPNTSLIQVTAASAAEATMLSTTKPSIELSEMSASVLLSENDGPKRVVGCLLTTPKMNIRVDQISGYEQAAKFPDTEAWAAPFTWLNTAFDVKKPLAAPVTGILGATYPADKVAEQYALATGDKATQTNARMDGEGPGPKTHRRALAAVPAPFLPVSSAIVGLGR